MPLLFRLSISGGLRGACPPFCLLGLRVMHRVSIFKIVFIVFKGLKAFTGVVCKDAIVLN